MKRGVNGEMYRPVTMAEVLSRLRADYRPVRAESLGGDLWPHLDGRGPSRSGPSSCAVAATYMLGRLRARGQVEQLRDRTWRAVRGPVKLLT